MPFDAAAFESHDRWWRDAGVDSGVAEAPVRWLDAETRPAPARETNASAFVFPPAAGTHAATAPDPSENPVLQPAPAWPDNFDAFQAFLREERRFPGGDYGGAAVPPAGPREAMLAIVTDMPSPADVAAGQLFSAEEGALLDAMLIAMGRGRADCYIMAIAASRPPSGEIPPADDRKLADFAHHHLALAAPGHLLILGEQSSRIMMGSPMLRMRGRLRGINLNGRDLSSANCFHPRTLLARPAYKKQAWQDLQILMKELPR